MKLLYGIATLFLFPFIVGAQNSSISGQLQTAEGEAVIFANIALLNASDSSLYKAEATNEAGVFRFKKIAAGTYLMKASYLGLKDFQKSDIILKEGEQLDLGVLKMESSSVNLKEARVVARRSLVEVKPDRTVFNVEGTINSTGNNALELLRKAPAVVVDNNNNVSVLGRSGVLIYVDGKRLPLTGEDLSSYLENLQADQIDRFDIITNPGAKYDAEGNAGIIDIRLKKDKNHGANGSINSTYSQGRFHRASLNGSTNYRNKYFNVFATGALNDGAGYNNMLFTNQFLEDGIFQDEINKSQNNWSNGNFRLGSDFFLGKNHTLGVLATANQSAGRSDGFNRIEIADIATPEAIDSILVAGSENDWDRSQQTYNVNYRFDNRNGRSFNMDLDYGNFINDTKRFQPNQYFNATEDQVLTEINLNFDTPSDIDIYTFSADYEDKLWGGVFGVGTKYSQVVSDNTFLVYDLDDDVQTLNTGRSNKFKYDEKVYAGYLSYRRPINKKLNLSLGLRAEQTDAMGDLEAFDPDKQEPPVDLNYLNWFPNAGISWQMAPMHSFNFNYGRRINRPDYNVLNPFNNQLSELSYEKGNPFLQPEIVNNLELGYTYQYRFNFKLGYSRTNNQITRLIAPDEENIGAGFITWENLANQTTYSFNASLPFQITKKWSSYWNFGATVLDNQADYGDGAVVDVQAFTYSFYQQQTINLPWKLVGEVSGYFSGPGVWGGVFRYESNWSLDLGLQRRFLNDALNVKLSVRDLFYQTGWNGESEFNGLVSTGQGRWDSRRGSISISYRFGNQNVKSRKRSTGIEDAAKRVEGGNN